MSADADLDEHLERCAAAQLARDGRSPSATEPPIRERLRQFSAALSRVEAWLVEFSDTWSEWDEHVENWLFSPEQLVGVCMCAGLEREIRSRVAEDPPDPWDPEDPSWGQHRLGEGWSDRYWDWLLQQPNAAAILNRSLSFCCCFLTEAQQLKFYLGVRSECLDYVRQRLYETHNDDDADAIARTRARLLAFARRLEGSGA